MVLNPTLFGTSMNAGGAYQAVGDRKRSSPRRRWSGAVELTAWLLLVLTVQGKLSVTERLDLSHPVPAALPLQGPTAESVDSGGEHTTKAKRLDQVEGLGKFHLDHHESRRYVW
jgi:hypothetical protein